MLDLARAFSLTGPLPSEWSAMRSLEAFYLSHTPGVEGTLPASWSALSNLRVWAVGLKGYYYYIYNHGRERDARVAGSRTRSW